MDDILECNFNSFKIVLFFVKWFRLRLNQNDPDRTVIKHDSGFTMINIRSFELVGDEPYVLPSQCEQMFYFVFYTNQVGHFLLDMTQEEGQ